MPLGAGRAADGTDRSARIVLRGGAVIAGDGAGPVSADVVVAGSVITAVGRAEVGPGDRVIDCSGRLVMPGFVDAHSHADGRLGDVDVQRSLLRQGVTTIIAGQDGVSYAPGPGAYGAEYFAAINGDHPGYRAHPGRVADYLASIDGRSRLNAAYLVPAGTLRWEVCGRSAEPATPDQLDRMRALVGQGLADGAVGLSTGLDYVPGLFADAAEIAALCVPVAAAGGVYVTHMRGGYEDNTATGIAEIAAIRAASGVSVHVSHFHAKADIVRDQLAALRRTDPSATFDAYPYTRGCSLLSMPLLPPALSVLPVPDLVARLADPAERQRLRRDWFPTIDRNASLGPQWPSMLTLAHVAAPDFAWTHGLTLAEAAERRGGDAIELALDLLVAARLEVNVIMAVRWERPDTELARIFAADGHLGGSDGIFVGAHPHPRARGTFARYLAVFVRELATWSWPEAVAHLSTGAVDRFALGRRGRVSPGCVADLIVVDPQRVRDRATYAEPLAEADGIDDVLVAGRPVLAGGELTDELPGRGLRRA